VAATVYNTPVVNTGVATVMVTTSDCPGSRFKQTWTDAELEPGPQVEVRGVDEFSGFKSSTEKAEEETPFDVSVIEENRTVPVLEIVTASIPWFVPALMLNEEIATVELSSAGA
jgi:hypothetical protein